MPKVFWQNVQIYECMMEDVKKKKSPFVWSLETKFSSSFYPSLLLFFYFSFSDPFYVVVELPKWLKW